MNPHANGPDWPYLLEMQRGVLRIVFKERVILVGQFPNFLGQSLVGLPEFWCGVMNHNGVVRPSWSSRKAS